MDTTRRHDGGPWQLFGSSFTRAAFVGGLHVNSYQPVDAPGEEDVMHGCHQFMGIMGNACFKLQFRSKIEPQDVEQCACTVPALSSLHSAHQLRKVGKRGCAISSAVIWAL